MAEADEAEIQPLPLADFFQSTPLLVRQEVGAEVDKVAGVTHRFELKLPQIQLHCPQTTCGGIRFFDPQNSLSLVSSKAEWIVNSFCFFTCRNCKKTFKTYAMRFWFFGFGGRVLASKLGEYPAFGEPRPNVIRDVLNDEIEFFERGYRSEVAGLGIGAFAYYRRFVESHKDKIISEIRKVAVAQGAAPEVIQTIDRALATDSFDKAVAAVKDAIPSSLRYQGGHSPLTLLHRALSGGIHNDDDIECLELAKDIRLVLTDLAERTTQALKNNDELGRAVGRLMSKTNRNS